MFLFSIALLFAGISASDCRKPKVYLIRHGEKPVDGDGLTAAGLQRAQCLRKVFGRTSGYNITHIMAQTPKKSESKGVITIKRQRPLDTVKPLANDLGIGVDTSCDRDDASCVKKVVESYAGTGDILICWEHKALTDITEAFGNKDSPQYPGKSFDLVWTMPWPYDKITEITSEHCPGLDQ